MNDKIREIWFEDVCLMGCSKEMPQLLILNGHSSYESLSIIEYAIQNNIHILSPPPHTTHALQPLDRCVFCPLNNAYNSACSDFLNQNQLNAINNGLFLEFGQLHGKRRSPRLIVKLVSNYVEFILLILLLLLQSC